MIRFPMPGPTLQDRLNILLDHLAEAEREYAAGVPYPDHITGSWPEKIEALKKRIAITREMIAND
jgi:hypothetical protein